MPPYRGPDSPIENAPPLAPMANDPNMVPMTGNDAAATRPPLPRLPDTMEAPNWTMSNSIASSFGLFEAGQDDIFDFLPMMPSLP